MLALVFFFFILALPFLLLPGAAHSRTLLIDLKSIYMKKAGQLMLLIPHIKALALPNPVKQATKEPTPILYAVIHNKHFPEWYQGVWLLC